MKFAQSIIDWKMIEDMEQEQIANLQAAGISIPDEESDNEEESEDYDEEDDADYSGGNGDSSVDGNIISQIDEASQNIDDLMNKFKNDSDEEDDGDDIDKVE